MIPAVLLAAALCGAPCMNAELARPPARWVCREACAAMIEECVATARRRRPGTRRICRRLWTAFCRAFGREVCA